MYGCTCPRVNRSRTLRTEYKSVANDNNLVGNYKSPLYGQTFLLG